MKLIVHVTQVRKAKGLTQADLAQLANVSRKTINTIENNVFVPSTILALTLAKVLHVSVQDLFTLPDTSDL
jgi:putative transcriptional regulator